MFNPTGIQGNMEDLPEGVKSKAPMTAIDKPKSDEFMSMMALMQVEYAKLNRDRNDWFIEKTKLETKIQVLEGKLRTFSSVNNDLISRIRLLEISLLESRNQKRENNETIVPVQEYDTEKMLERKARIGGSYKRGRHLLNQYIREVMNVEDHIKKTGEAGNIVKNLFSKFRGKAYSEIFELSLPRDSKCRKPSTKSYSSNDPQNKDSYMGDEMIPKERKASSSSKGRIVPRGQSKLSSKTHDVDSLFDFLTVEDSSSKDDSDSDKLDSEELNREIAQAMNEVEMLTKVIDVDETSTSTDDTSIGSLKDIQVEMNEIEGKSEPNADIFNKIGSWKLNFILRGHLDCVYSVKFHPRHKILATTSEDGVICLYDIKKMSNLDNLPMAYLRGHKSPVVTCTFDEDGLYLYTADKNGEIIVWNPLGDAEVLERYETNGEPVWDVSHSRNSRMLLSGSADGICRLWKPDSLTPVSTMSFSKSLISASYYPLDHSKLVIASMDTVYYYDAINETIIDKIISEGKIRSAATNPKQPIFATGWEDKNIKILDIRQARYIQDIVAHPYPISSLCYCSSGDTLISGSTNGAINVWSKTYECIEAIQSHRTKSYGGVVSLDQHDSYPYLASGGADDVAKIYVYS